MLHSLDSSENKELRDFFQESGYTMDTLMSRFRSLEIPALHLVKLYLMGVPLEPSRTNTLLRWFWIGDEVDGATARQFIPERPLSLLLRSGVLEEGDGRYAPSVRISPFDSLLIASDHVVSRTGPLRADTVLWPNPTTLLSDQMTMKMPVGRTLDLGTGNGVLALSAASHSGAVVATDINGRAREFCLFNAALNGISNVEFREGSAFEPVEGERFDLIVANPPFFVTPSVRHVYSDNSMELDGFCHMLVRQAREHLNENGYCQMLMEWVQIKGQPWRERLAQWFHGLGCDVWVMACYMRSAAEYAMIRVQEGNEHDPARQSALCAEWQAYFESHQVESIIGGMTVLRRREGRNWVRMEELRSSPSRPLGNFLRRVIDHRDFLDAHPSDEEILATRPALPPTARLHKQFAVSPQGWKPAAIELQPGEGLPYSLALQPLVADFVALCDGSRTLAAIADQTAAAAHVDPAIVRREACGIIRQLAGNGLMLLSAHPSSTTSSSMAGSSPNSPGT